MLFLLVTALCSCEKDPSDDNLPFIADASWSGDTLTITGDFDPEKGKVYVDDQAVPTNDIVDWKSSEIICHVTPPASEEVKIVVETGTRKSQPKVITIQNIFRITYLQVHEKEDLLYVYGHFGSDPGPAKRSVTINGINDPLWTTIKTWTPKLIVCDINCCGANSSGEVVIKKGNNLSTSRILNEWTTDLYYQRPQGGSLREEIFFSIRLRGDFGPPPAGVNLVNIQDDDANFASESVFKVGGSGSSVYADCNKVNVDWESFNDYITLKNNTENMTGKSHFQTAVNRVNSGVELAINFDAWDAIPSTLTYTDCGGNTIAQQRKDMIDFTLFDHEKIKLEFDGKKIKAGKITSVAAAPTSGLIWDAIDYPAQLVPGTVEWQETAARW